MAPERTQGNRALQAISAYQEEVMGKPFWVSRLFVDTVDMSEEIIRRYVRHHEKMEQIHEQQMELLK